MLKPLKKIDQLLDRWLFQRGFHFVHSRALLRIQLWIASVCPVILISIDWRLGRDFFFGACLATINFYFLAKLTQQIIFVRKGATAVLLFSFYFRLLLTALVLASLIVWLRVSVVALLVGLSTVLISILLWGGEYFLRKNSRRHKNGC